MKKLRSFLHPLSVSKLTTPTFLLSTFCFLLLYMPFHVFLSQWVGTSTGTLEFWKIFKDLVLICLFVATGALVMLTVAKKKWSKYTTLLVLAAVYAVLHIVLYVINKDTTLEVAALASTYNNRFIWAFLVGLGIGLLRPSAAWFTQCNIIKLVLGVSTLLCVLGLLQVVLPDDILTHFGYQIELGVKPNFFINEDPAYPRVFATFRDPNSFGAYLIIPIVLLVQLIQKHKKKWLIGGLLALHLTVVYLSFSRAAWGGLIVALGVYFLLAHQDKAKLALKSHWLLLLMGLFLVGFAVYSVRNTPAFRSVVLRDDGIANSSVPGSDELHWQYIEEGIQEVVDQPLGYGPGTAGIVSIHNDDGGQLTENYYVQIAHEVGVVGLVLFFAIWGLVIKQLLAQKRTPLVVALLASAVAYLIMAMVMHLWTNEAVAYTWWGLAGLSLALAGKDRSKAT